MVGEEDIKYERVTTFNFNNKKIRRAKGDEEKAQTKSLECLQNV